MRLIVFLSIMLSFGSAFGQTYEAVSLYANGALVTGRFLPFKIYNTSKEAQPIASAFVYGPCETLIDYHRSEVFHVYCTESADIDLIIRLKNGSLLSIKDIPVKKVSLIEPEIIIGTGKSLGEQLFMDNCMECHRTEPIGKGQTAASVRQALSTYPMKDRGLNLLFNDDQEKIDALVEYINEEL